MINVLYVCFYVRQLIRLLFATFLCKALVALTHELSHNWWTLRLSVYANGLSCNLIGPFLWRHNVKTMMVDVHNNMAVKQVNMEIRYVNYGNYEYSLAILVELYGFY